MKKIGIECRSIEEQEKIWGVGKMLIKLLEEISRRPELEKNFRFILYFKDTIPNFDFLNVPIFEKKKVPVPFFKGKLFPIYYFALLPMKLWFERLDWMFWPNYMLPIIAFNKSTVTLTEDVYYETREGKLPFRYRLAYGIFAWWTAKFANKIMAISETSKKNISRLYKIKPDRIFVNYLGVDAPKIGHFSLIASHYILFIGQAFPRRHLHETLLAFETISKDFPDLKFIAIGPDKYEKLTINNLVSEINHRLSREAVIHKNYVDEKELTELYANAKALTYVSDREAFGLPPMEALSYGVPPIIKDNELGRELFGEYAFYAKNSGSNGITEAIRQALVQSDKIEKIEHEGPKYAQKFSWQKFADKFISQL